MAALYSWHTCSNYAITLRPMTARLYGCSFLTWLPSTPGMLAAILYSTSLCWQYDSQTDEMHLITNERVGSGTTLETIARGITRPYLWPLWRRCVVGQEVREFGEQVLVCVKQHCHLCVTSQFCLDSMHTATRTVSGRPDRYHMLLPTDSTEDVLCFV